MPPIRTESKAQSAEFIFLVSLYYFSWEQYWNAVCSMMLWESKNKAPDQKRNAGVGLQSSTLLGAYTGPGSCQFCTFRGGENESMQHTCDECCHC